MEKTEQTHCNQIYFPFCFEITGTFAITPSYFYGIYNVAEIEHEAKMKFYGNDTRVLNIQSGTPEQR